jgi:hypothetical protein
MKFKNFVFMTIAVAFGVGSVEAFKAYMQIQAYKDNCYQVAQSIIDEDKADKSLIESTKDEVTKMKLLVSQSQRITQRILNNNGPYAELRQNCKAYEKEIVQWMEKQK